MIACALTLMQLQRLVAVFVVLAVAVYVLYLLGNVIQRRDEDDQ